MDKFQANDPYNIYLLHFLLLDIDSLIDSHVLDRDEYMKKSLETGSFLWYYKEKTGEEFL